MKVLKLPWLADESALLRHEVERYAAMTPEQRAEHVDALCEAGAALLAAHPRLDAVKAWREPLPESTVRILQKLRKAHLARNG